MKFKVGHYYTHISVLDCIVKVKKNFEEKDKQAHLIVSWFTKSGLDMNVTNVININEHEFDKWYEWEK